MLENDYQAFGGNELCSLAVLHVEEDFASFFLLGSTVWQRQPWVPVPLIPILSDINW